MMVEVAEVLEPLVVMRPLLYLVLVVLGIK